MMESSFTILRVRGIPIGAHWSWLFVFALVLWSLATVLFPATYPGLDGGTYLAMAAAAAVLFFASVLATSSGTPCGRCARASASTASPCGCSAGWPGCAASPSRPGPSSASPPPVPRSRWSWWRPSGVVALGAGRLGWPDGVRGVFDYL
ncbi:MAG TPA: hypothetical protein VF468_27345, partial [Actinomycetota bacterium]|nr:hypothetical protein [Actinomycetota bacterium]